MKVISLSKDGNFLKVVKVTSQEKPYQLKHAKLEIYKDYKGAFKEDEQVVSLLTGAKVYQKKIQIPFRSRSKIEKALEFQIDALPFSRAKHSIHTSVTNSPNNSAQVNITAAPIEEIEQHVEQFKKVDVQIAWLGSDRQSLNRFMKAHKMNDLHLILHISIDHSHLYYVRECEVIHTFQIPLGANKLGGMVNGENLSQINPTQLGRFILQIERFIDFVRENEGEKELTLLSLGYGASLSLFSGYSEGIVPYTHHISEQELFYAREIGAALDVLSKDEKTVQFLNGNFTPKQHITSIKKKIYQFTALGSLTLLTLFAGFTYHQYRQVNGIEKALKKELCKAALHSKTSYLSSTNIDELLENMEDLEDYFDSKSLFYDAEQSPLPVHNLLKVIAQEGRFDKSIQSLQYELVEFPTPKSPKSSYKALVKVGFTSMENAHQFTEVVTSEELDMIKDMEILDEENEAIVQFTTV